MKYLKPLVSIALLATCATPVVLQAATDPDWEVIDSFCGECHNSEDFSGGIAFDLLPRDKLQPNAETWEHALRMVRTGLMPPKGQPRPTRAKFESFIAQLEQKIDAEVVNKPAPGTVGLSRLNRAEYANAIRDLLAFDASGIVDKLPADVTPEGGFDNMSDALTVSPTLIDSYAGAAMRISREAVGDRTMIPTQIKYSNPGGIQSKHVEGLPLGTRGGMLVTHNFPLDAQYEIKIASGARGVLGGSSFCGGPSLVVMINGEPMNMDKPQDFNMVFPAGPITIGAALVDDKHCEGVNEFYDDYAISGGVQSIEIHGPFEATGPGITPSRQAIFSCYPQNREEESACALEVMSNLASKAFRHHVASDAPELKTLMSFYQRGAEKEDFELGIQYAISRLLIDPRFLYRVEEEPAGLAQGDIYQISDIELASRLSFFLWSSIPDQELITLAEAGKLSDAGVLEKQVHRMLTDPKANALVENFAGQWLMLRQLDAALPQDRAFTPSLKAAFRSETELLFKDMIAEDTNVLDLLSADHTYLNEELAAHYGIPNVRGTYMRRVSLPEDSLRRGLLGHGSILTATSVANRTSPVVRGKWIVENILGAPVPVPPPGVETDLTKNQDDDGRIAHTLRDRLELHLKDPTCASCHQVMDPMGFALENFDLIGRWREMDNGYALDTTSEMVDGTLIRNAADMRKALLARGDTVATTITERLMTYGLGRETQASDMPAVRRIMSEARKQDYRFSALILGIVNSVPFRMKEAVGDGSTQNVAVAGVH